VRKQLEQIVNVLLDGVEITEIDSTFGSLSRLANAIWIVDAMEDHKQGVLCMDLLKVYCIGKQIMGSDCTVFLTFVTGYNLLNIWRATGTGYDVQLHGDMTGKAGHPILLSANSRLESTYSAPTTRPCRPASLMPADSESSEV
jgi:hypothetical protein